MARYDDLNTNMIAYATVLSIVVLVIVLQGAQALSYNMMSSESYRKASTAETTSGKTKSEQLESLNGFKKVSVIDDAAPPPKKGEEQPMKQVIQIPVTEAQRLILEELKSASATPGT